MALTCMVYNINTVITTAPKIPKTHLAVVVDDDAVIVIACDFTIVQNVVLFATTVALLK